MGKHVYGPVVQQLLIAESAQESQKRGRPGQLVDPRPEAVAGGEIKIVITPQLVHDIFEEYPVVAKAYNETVPKQVSIIKGLTCLCQYHFVAGGGGVLGKIFPIQTLQ